MPFIRDHERIILFDLPNVAGDYLTPDDLRALRDAGIETVLRSGTEWDRYETFPGKYDSGYFSRIMDQYRQAGMKTILPLWVKQTTIYTDAWYQQGENHKVGEYILSPWNRAAQDHACEVIQRVKGEHGADDCLIVPTFSRYGESVVPNNANYCDPWAEKSWKEYGQKRRMDWLREAYVRLVADQQAICADNPWKEAWFFFHLPKVKYPNCGVQWFDDYIRALPEGTTVNHVTFNYFNARWEGIAEQIADLRCKHNTSEWCGAEYCEGLRNGNAERARQADMRGLILAPVMPTGAPAKIEPWMLKEIRKVTDGTLG